MPTFCDLLPRTSVLALAVRAHPPTRLAETFAAHSGQFYNRAAFDLLAREAEALYAASDADQAAAFRRRLDARLEQREREAVAWSADSMAPPA